jgi:hypothetical protein
MAKATGSVKPGDREGRACIWTIAIARRLPEFLRGGIYQDV